MINNTIQTLLASLASTGVCQTGKRYLQGTPQDLEVLIKVWRRWPEYWSEHSSFAIEMLRKFLNEDTKQYLAQKNLFFDFAGHADLDMKDATPVFVVGDSNVTLTTKDYGVAKIYLFNNARVSIACGKKSVVFVEAYDDTQFCVSKNNDSEICVYQYDMSVVVGDAKIKKCEHIRGEVFNGQETEKPIN